MTSINIRNVQLERNSVNTKYVKTEDVTYYKSNILSNLLKNSENISADWVCANCSLSTGLGLKNKNNVNTINFMTSSSRVESPDIVFFSGYHSLSFYVSHLSGGNNLIVELGDGSLYGGSSPIQINIDVENLSINQIDVPLSGVSSYQPEYNLNYNSIDSEDSIFDRIIVRRVENTNYVYIEMNFYVSSTGISKLAFISDAVSTFSIYGLCFQAYKYSSHYIPTNDTLKSSYVGSNYFKYSNKFDKTQWVKNNSQVSGKINIFTNIDQDIPSDYFAVVPEELHLSKKIISGTDTTFLKEITETDTNITIYDKELNEQKTYTVKRVFTDKYLELHQEYEGHELNNGFYKVDSKKISIDDSFIIIN